MMKTNIYRVAHNFLNHFNDLWLDNWMIISCFYKKCSLIGSFYHNDFMAFGICLIHWRSSMEVCRVSKSYAMYAQRAEAVYGIPSSSFHSPLPPQRENGMRGGGDRFRFSSGILRPSRQWAGGAANGQRNTRRRPSSVG